MAIHPTGLEINHFVSVYIHSPSPEKCCHKVVLLLGCYALIARELRLEVGECFWDEGKKKTQILNAKKTLKKTVGDVTIRGCTK